MFSISADIVILALVAGVVLFRLYSILGQKDDDGVTIQDKNFIPNVIDISGRVKTEEAVDLSELEKDIAPSFNNVLEQIRKIDANFSLRKFLEGAKRAFEMILIAFSENDRDKLKFLLNDEVYKQFIQEIEKRTQNKIKVSLTLVALPVVEIRNIQLIDKKVIIDVFYNSQQITLLKNETGEVIEGNPSQIDNVEDMWRFAKDLNDKQNWLLINVNAN